MSVFSMASQKREQPGPIILNIFGGPGVGKTTTAWKIGASLAELGYSVDVLPEFAKQLTHANVHTALQDRLFVFASQNHQLELLRCQAYDFVVVDCPLPTTLAYRAYQDYAGLEPLIIETFKSYPNQSYFLKRETEYIQVGRNETLQAALEVDKTLHMILRKHDIAHTAIGLAERDLILMDALRAKAPTRNVLELATDISGRVRDAAKLLRPKLAAANAP